MARGGMMSKFFFLLLLKMRKELTLWGTDMDISSGTFRRRSRQPAAESGLKIRGYASFSPGRSEWIRRRHGTQQMMMKRVGRLVRIRGARARDMQKTGAEKLEREGGRVRRRPLEDGRVESSLTGMHLYKAETLRGKALFTGRRGYAMVVVGWG